MLQNKTMMKIEKLEDILSASLYGSTDGTGRVVVRALDMIRLLKDEIGTAEDNRKPSQRKEVALSAKTTGDPLSRQHFMESMSRASHVYTGLEAALEWLAEKFQEASGVTTTFTKSDERISVDKGVGHFLYQISHELLTNIGKHAEATNVSISVEKRENNIRVCAEDDGKGFDESEIEILKVRRKWHGFLKIREGINYLGGKLSIESGKGKGTRVVIEVPAALTGN
ncbi:MAG: hypothetical protein JW743_07600 [Deltaproteobacteria bacterium]|nr:hypothetical protein [Deltaproteobacteria bacterium]MBN2845605.1 hypothetical protein [Deltaproteobacteria bacterium]